MNYTPQVGDRVRLESWSADQWIYVKYVGQERFFGHDDDGDESSWRRFGLDWVKVEPRPELPELPEVWLPIVQLSSGKLYCSGVSFRTPEQAMWGERTVAAVKCTPDPDSVVWADEVQS